MQLEPQFTSVKSNNIAHWLLTPWREPAFDDLSLLKFVFLRQRTFPDLSDWNVFFYFLCSAKQYFFRKSKMKMSTKLDNSDRVAASTSASATDLFQIKFSEAKIVFSSSFCLSKDWQDFQSFIFTFLTKSLDRWRDAWNNQKLIYNLIYFSIFFCVLVVLYESKIFVINVTHLVLKPQHINSGGSWFGMLFFKMGLSRPLFLYFRLFNTQLTVNVQYKSLPNDWIQTVDLGRRKQPLYQLSHNHCLVGYVVTLLPRCFFHSTICFRTSI